MSNTNNVANMFDKNLRTSGSSDLTNAKANKIVFIPFKNLVQSTLNRKVFFVDDELKEAIKQDGLLTPLSVKRLDNDSYEILSGNRRYEAFKSILATNPTFKYMFASEEMLDPINKGLPCVICEKKLSQEQETLLTIEFNKNRIFDKLELYQMVMSIHNIYPKLKNLGEVKETREREFIASKCPVSEGTISSILADEWLINSKNIQAVKKAGSWIIYESQNKDKKIKSNNPKEKVKKSAYEKEDELLQNLIKKYENKEISNDVHSGDLKKLQRSSLNLITYIKKTYQLLDNEVIQALKKNA